MSLSIRGSPRGVALQEVSQDASHPAQREIGVGPHRVAVRAEWARGKNAAVVGTKIGDDVAPLSAIHQQAVREGNDRARAGAGAGTRLSPCAARLQACVPPYLLSGSGR